MLNFITRFLSCITLVATLAEVGVSAENRDVWVTPRGDFGATGYVPESLPQGLSVIWEAKTTEAIETTPVVDEKAVYVTDVMGGIEALSREDGKSIWRKEFQTGFVASPSLLIPATVTQSWIDMPLLASDNQAIDAEKESEIRQSLASGLRPMLIVGDVEGQVLSLEPATGETIWKQTTEGEINAAPSFFAIVDPSGQASIRVLVTSQDGKLRCFDALSGKPVWTYATNDQIRCGASLADGKTFFGGCDGALHVVDLVTGTVVGEPIELAGPTGSTPAVANDEVYVPIMDGVAYRFNLSDSTRVWTYEDMEQTQDYRGDVAIGPDRIILASRGKDVDAIDRSTGERLWRTTLRRRPDASPLIVGKDVWVPSSDGRLTRLNLADGSESWNYEIRGAFVGGVAIAGDQLFIADDDGVVRCFGKM